MWRGVVMYVVQGISVDGCLLNDRSVMISRLDSMVQCERVESEVCAPRSEIFLSVV